MPRFIPDEGELVSINGVYVDGFYCRVSGYIS